jgi:Sec-independent protein translocase protein TatA
MNLKLPHQLKTEGAAILRAKQAINEMRSQLPANAKIDQETWSGNTLTFAATADKITITGSLVVTDKEYDVTAKLPFMLRMFEGRIEKAIRAQTAEMLKQGK